jgi:hypothetical protein
MYMYDENGDGVHECLPTMQQEAGTLPALSKWSQNRISYECPALELLTFNAIIFDVAAPVSAALLFLSLFFCGAETVGDPYCRSCHYCW